MSRPMIEIELAGCGSLIRGYRARELYERVTGRAPVYIPLARGYSCQEKTAKDVIAIAEAQGFDVVVTGKRTSRERALDALMAAPIPSLPEREAGLW